MTDAPPPKSELILYQTEDGRTRIQCRFEDETLWLTQAQMADLFQTTPQNITLHLDEILAGGELALDATCNDYLLNGGAWSTCATTLENAKLANRPPPPLIELPLYQAAPIAWIGGGRSSRSRLRRDESHTRRATRPVS